MFHLILLLFLCDRGLGSFYSLPRVVRTPEERFANLAQYGYPWKPNYYTVSLAGKPPMRMHYLDIGSKSSAETILLLHGTPSWSFLYRKMIPPLVSAGYRVVVPDFIGFGRSDKLTDPKEYNHELHVQSLLQLVRFLNLQGITLFGQDLGGPTGLSVLRLEPTRFRRLVLYNTWIPQGDIFHSLYQTFRHIPYLSWRVITSILKRSVPVKLILNSVSDVSKDQSLGYAAPFPSNVYKAGPSQWPLFIPLSSYDPVAIEMQIVKQFLKNFWKGPVLFGFSDGELFTTSGRDVFREALPGACEMDVSDAGHYLQEDQGPFMAMLIINLIKIGNNVCTS